MGNFCQLHLHEHIGSRLDAIGSSGEYAKKAVDYGHKALASTDHGRISGLYEHQVECIQHGIKPIFGLEAYVTKKLVTMNDLGKRVRTKNNHLVLLVKNEIGYKNLLKLNYLSMSDTDHFYYSPRISLQELYKNKEGLMIGTACIANPVSRLVLDGKIEEAETLYEEMTVQFGDDFYTEIQLNELAEQKIVNEFMIRMANKMGIMLVITGDVHYLEKGQNQIQTLAIAIRDKTTIDNLKFELESKNLYYHDIKDYIDFNKEFGYNYKESDILNWCNNTMKVADKCNFVIPERNKIYLPTLTDNDDGDLIKKGKRGIMEKFNVDNYKDVPAEYRKRLERELEVIIRKGFSSYFLIVEDITQFSIREKIYGRFGRGSVGGSLLAYALGIHNLDPIKRNLLFERFMSDSRSPDLVIKYYE